MRARAYTRRATLAALPRCATRTLFSRSTVRRAFCCGAGGAPGASRTSSWATSTTSARGGRCVRARARVCMWQMRVCVGMFACARASAGAREMRCPDNEVRRVRHATPRARPADARALRRRLAQLPHHLLPPRHAAASSCGCRVRPQTLRRGRCRRRGVLRRWRRVGGRLPRRAQLCGDARRTSALRVPQQWIRHQVGVLVHVCAFACVCVCARAQALLLAPCGSSTHTRIFAHTCTHTRTHAISTPAAEQFRGDGIAGRAGAYGLRALRVDGNDALAVREAVAHAREAALKVRRRIHCMCVCVCVCLHAPLSASAIERNICLHVCVCARTHIRARTRTQGLRGGGRRVHDVPLGPPLHIGRLEPLPRR